jgi:hypothetical protein
MSLQPGIMLGPYRVVSALGEGGPPPLAQAAGASCGEVSPKPNREPRP